MDTVDRVVVFLVCVGVFLGSVAFTIHYVDKRICDVKDGVMIEGKCLDIKQK